MGTKFEQNFNDFLNLSLRSESVERNKWTETFQFAE